jgi:predicted DNA-binding protein (MmcQ/YjbR family)
MEDKFKIWLEQNGAEILPCTNEHELIRFKGSEVGVKYKSGKYSNKYAENAFLCYKNNKKWDGRPVSVGRQKNYIKEKKVLLNRDGSDCFYCGKPLLFDITLEHLISLVSGGPNTLSNMVLAHEKCNNQMQNKGVAEKVSFALFSRKSIVIKEKPKPIPVIIKPENINLSTYLTRQIWNEIIAKPKNEKGQFNSSPAKLKSIIEKTLTTNNL